jgi:nickel-type superoxide dismutase maturation protease
MSYYKEGLRAVAASWRNALQWATILTPSLVAFSDNIGSIHIVSGISMQPTLNPAPDSSLLDVVWVSKMREFKQGDIVVLKDPTRECHTRIIKRVSKISHDGSTIVVLGDNREHSTDSRVFGPVPSVMVEGVVSRVIFPPWRISASLTK